MHHEGSNIRPIRVTDNCSECGTDHPAIGLANQLSDSDSKYFAVFYADPGSVICTISDPVDNA